MKFTFTDSGLAQPSVTFGQTTGGTSTLRFGYSGATTGTNQYLSCILTQGTGSSETVKYYGKLADCATVGNGVFSIDTSGLTHSTTYTLKVFSEQANSNSYSDFASATTNFTLTVNGSGKGTVTNGTSDNASPTVSSTSPTSTDVAVGTSTLSVTFNEAMNTAVTSGAPVGTVSLSPAGAALTFSSWSSDGKTANYALSGLAGTTSYTYNISGFQDAAGNEMAAVSSGLDFTTAAAPSSPSPTTPTPTPDPGSGSPQTGDGSNLGLWALLLCVSLAALVAGAWLFFRRRNNSHTETT